MLQKIVIHNFKIFRDFTLEFNRDVNIIVGDNEAGKSTVLEAINIALTGRIFGRPLQSELTSHMFNQAVVAEYLEKVNRGEKVDPPEIIIELYFTPDPDTARLKGSNNLLREDAPGVRVRATFDQEFAEDYRLFISERAVASIPVEFYTMEWLHFGGSPLTQRSVPVTASMINAAKIRLQSGADYYLQQIIGSTLDDKQRVALTRAFRDLQATFSENQSIETINGVLNAAKGDISDKSLSLEVDLSQKTGWESGLVPHLDRLPFNLIGSGEQNALKILLAVNRKLDDSHVVLVEEPENHLSFSTLNRLIGKIEEKCKDRQIIITTHSSFVINKLGLGKLILLNGEKTAKLDELTDTTQDYFMKLSGYDTLRLVLARKTLMVEGPSDELVVQRAYRDLHGRLPIHDGVDVLNMRGLTSERFLEIARVLGKTVHVITDNDGDVERVDEKFKQYEDDPTIHINRCDDPKLRSLEQNMVAANGLDRMNTILGKKYATESDLIHYMTNRNNKTTCGLAVFSTTEPVKMPEYILEAVK